MLKDRKIPYKKITVRANSIKTGDLIEINGKTVVALEVHKTPLKSLYPNSEPENLALLQEVAEAGAKDKISEGFDEYTTIRYAVFNHPKIVSEEAIFAEWEFVKTWR